MLVLDSGPLMGLPVDQTGERTRQALQIADAMAPCMVMIDQIEKAFTDVGNSGPTDSGVSTPETCLTIPSTAADLKDAA